MKALRKIIRFPFAVVAQAAVLLSAATAFMSLPLAAATSADATSRLAALGDLPLYFEAHSGATAGDNSFVSRGRGFGFVVTPTETVVTLTKCDLPFAGSRTDRALASRSAVTLTRSLQLRFLNANPHARMSGVDELPGKVNYILGNNPAKWRTGLPLFARVRVEAIYPGVDLVYYGNERHLEYDFIVAPKADPDVIALHVAGADNIHLDAHGDLVFTLGPDEVIQPKPRIYQTVAGVRKEVAGGYQFAGPKTVTFQLGEYDRELPLVIDPVLSYSTFFGKGGSDIGWDIAVDKSGTNGSIYIAGQSTSANLPVTTTNTFGGGNSAGDVFVARFNPTGTAISYLTYLGGNGQDGALAIALDAQGNACITGFTTSTNFPTPNGIRTNLTGAPYPGVGAYDEDAFIAKLNPSGLALYSTYLGGSATDLGVSVAVDPTGAVYVSGSTDSTNFYTVNALYTNLAGQDDGFVAKINSSGTAFDYCTYLGGTNMDHADGLAVDAAGFAYVTGYTISTNFPISPTAPQRFLNNPAPDATNHITGERDVFVTKILPDGSGLVYSTYLGGAQDDSGFRLALDDQQSVYVTGSTLSLNFPIAPAWNTNWPKGLYSGSQLPDVFVTKLDAAGTNWSYSFYFGGADADEGWDIAVDTLRRAHLVGESYSLNFPTVKTNGPLRGVNSGYADVFVTVVGATGTTVVRSAYLGGAGVDFGYGIETDNAGNDFLVGQTASVNFPTVAPYQPAIGGSVDAFIAKILVEPVLVETLAGPNVLLSWAAYAPEYTLQSNTNVASSNGWVTVTTPPVLSNGWHTVTLGNTNSPLFFRLRKP